MVDENRRRYKQETYEQAVDRAGVVQLPDSDDPLESQLLDLSGDQRQEDDPSEVTQ